MQNNITDFYLNRCTTNYTINGHLFKKSEKLFELI